MSEDNPHRRDIIVLGLAFLLLYSAFSVVQNLASSVLPPNVAFWSLGSLYISVALGNFLATWVADKIGLRVSLSLAALAYHLFVVANIFALDKEMSFQLALLVPSALLLGFASSVLWNSQGSYLTRCSPPDYLAFNTGLFFFGFLLSGVVGNVAAAVLFSSLATTQVYLILLGIGALGSVMLLFLRKAPDEGDMLDFGVVEEEEEEEDVEVEDAKFHDTLDIPSRTSSVSTNHTGGMHRDSILARMQPNYESVVSIYGLDDPAREAILDLATPATKVAAPTRPPRARPPNYRSYSMPLTSSTGRAILPEGAVHGLAALHAIRSVSWDSFHQDSDEPRQRKLLEVVNTIRTSKALLLMLLVWFYGASQAFLFGSLPLYVQAGESNKLYMMAIVAAIDALGALVLSRFADNIGRRWLLIIGASLCIAAMALLTFTDAVNNLPVLFATGALFGLSDASLQTTLSVLVAHLFADSSVAGFATFNFFEAVATGVAFFCSGLFIVDGENGELPRMVVWLPLVGSLYVSGVVCLLILHYFVYDVELGGTAREKVPDVEYSDPVYTHPAFAVDSKPISYQNVGIVVTDTDDRQSRSAAL